MSFCLFEGQFYFTAAGSTPEAHRGAAAVEGWGLGAILLALVRRVLAGLTRCCTA